MKNKEPITPGGAKLLRKEIQRIKAQERPAVIKAITEARAHGDLKENAEYHAAKEKQGLIEARLRDLENLLADAHVIDHLALKSETVTFGATVTLEELESGTEKKYQIVGKFEADVKKGRIPVSSPLAKSLIGKQVGEEVKVTVPKGIQEFEIKHIEYVEIDF